MTTAEQSASRALRPGSRRVIALALAGVAVAVAVSVGALSTGSKGSPPNSSPSKGSASNSSPSTGSASNLSSAKRSPASSSAKYGQIPSWLPKPKVRVGRTAVATPARPWLAIEGDTVSVRFAHARVLATAVGPAVPHEGQFPVPATTPCTFTITFTAASGAVPLNAKAFMIIDEYGHLHHPRVTATGGGPLPPQLVAPGGTVSLTVNDVLPTGNGRLRWAPYGATPIVSWDFDVEID
jgi:hypothetical protein